MYPQRTFLWGKIILYGLLILERQDSSKSKEIPKKRSKAIYLKNTWPLKLNWMEFMM